MRPSIRCAFVLTALAAAAGCGGPGGAERTARGPAESAAAPSGIRYLAADETPASGFEYATTPPTLEFPADHAAHPGFRTEWWYFTGNLDGRSGRYGFELTVFRYALAPGRPPGGSAWSSNQVWMAHLAVTDAADDTMIAEERLARGALGLAGAERDPLRIWVESWSIAAAEDGGPHTFVLDAQGDRVGIRLRLDAVKPPVAHGRDGLDRKGPEPGNASHYYSLTRLAAAGTVTVGGETDTVEGLAWMDREWSTSALSPDVEGWDWFALQLSDGRDLMLYRLRRPDGSTSPFSGGSLVGPDGERLALGPDDFVLEPSAVWQSPLSGIRYPIGWRLRVPPASIELDVLPIVEDQEVRLSVRYWEGAVRVRGTARGEPVTGRGYLELAGY